MENNDHKKASGTGFFRSPHQNGATSPDIAGYRDYRRYVLLKTSLIVIAVIGGGFSLINFYRGLIVFASTEVAVMLVSIILLYLIRRSNQFTFVRLAFLIMACTFGLFASANPNTYSTVFVWNALGPIFAFYLLGKRWGLAVSAIFLSLATALFLWSHTSGKNALPFFSFLNMAVLLLGVTMLTLYYEITRSETEEALVKDIAERERAEREKEKLIKKLQDALAEVETLSGLLPMCSSCKKVRDDKGYWNQIDAYIQQHSRAQFSHGICPECAEKLYGEEAWFQGLKKK